VKATPREAVRDSRRWTREPPKSKETNMHFHATALEALRQRVNAQATFDPSGLHADLEVEMLIAGVVVNKAPVGSLELYFFTDADDPKDLREQYELATRLVNEDAVGRGPLLKALGLMKPVSRRC